MTSENGPGCERPTTQVPKVEKKLEKQEVKEGDTMTQVRVGQPAPDFSAPAYINGKFTRVSLADKKGKWLLVCFYPGDFTFV